MHTNRVLPSTIDRNRTGRLVKADIPVTPPQRADRHSRWEDTFPRKHLLAIMRAFAKSLFEVRPIRGKIEYYRVLIAALALSIINRAPVHPSSLLKQDVWVAHRGCLYLLTTQTVFGYYLHAFEPATSKILDGLRGATFLDIGANVGQYTVPLSRSFKRVIAVEPNPLAVEILKENLARNDIRNVDVIPKAVTAVSGLVSLYRGGYLTTWNTREGKATGITVQSVTLDELLQQCGNVDLLKMDIEGAEREVLSSSEGLKKVSRISVAGTSSELKQVRSLLEGLGFHVSIPQSSWGIEENAYAVPRDHAQPARIGET